jgi:hypothetical protein
MMALSLFVDGIALWTPQWPNWASAQDALLGESASVVGLNLTQPAFHAPTPSLLTPAERRRAPATVALALEVATAAAAMSGRNAAELTTVFTSVHGDLAINDAMCRALIEAPRLVSPTKFINSVHNAPAGYWAIATGCQQASTARQACSRRPCRLLLTSKRCCWSAMTWLRPVRWQTSRRAAAPWRLLWCSAHVPALPAGARFQSACKPR